VRSNTVLANWIELRPEPARERAELRFGRLLMEALRLERNVVLLDADPPAWARLEQRKPDERRIDVWWRDDESSRLMLLFAHLVTRSEGWDEAKIRVLVPTRAEKEQRVLANLEHKLDEARISASVETVVELDAERMVACSGDAALVLVTLEVAGLRFQDGLGLGLHSFLDRLPLVAWTGSRWSPSSRPRRMSSSPKRSPSREP
jgi:hypothetical protein